MKVEINREPKLSRIDNLFILAAEDELTFDLPGDLSNRITAFIKSSGFGGRKEESITILDEDPSRITLIGMGKRDAIGHRAIRAALYAVGKIARKNRQQNIAVHLPYDPPGSDSTTATALVADLLANVDYQYDRYLTSEEAKDGLPISATLIPASGIDKKTARKLTERAEIVADSVRLVRDLGNGPGNLVTPTQLAQRAQEVAREAGFKCTVYDKKQIEKMKMGGLLAVNQGSAQEPRFIVLEYTPARAKKTVCLVGKGITFDSGGISIKPSERMEEMKFDMCGASAVIGALRAAALSKVPHKVIGLIVSTENLPSGSAYKPGDIVTTMSGKTVEIVNTDAEGRMILCDALHYAARFKPDHLIDFATLTGACVVALGYEASGLFSNDDELARKLIECGERVGERLWRLPEWDEYKEHIRSEWADVKNSGGRWAGAITAALFLKQFVDSASWAHIDIAGTAWTENETARERKGATGVGVRLTLEFLENLD